VPEPYSIALSLSTVYHHTMYRSPTKAAPGGCLIALFALIPLVFSIYLCIMLWAKHFKEVEDLEFSS